MKSTRFPADVRFAASRLSLLACRECVATWETARDITKGSGVVGDTDEDFAHNLVNRPAAAISTPRTEVYVKKIEYDMDDVFNLTPRNVTPRAAARRRPPSRRTG